jgi:hypothetical protein
MPHEETAKMTAHEMYQKEGVVLAADQKDEWESRIRTRAYEIWEREERPAGRDFDHWIMAERALLAGGRPVWTETTTKTGNARKTSPRAGKKASRPAKAGKRIAGRPVKPKYALTHDDVATLVGDIDDASIAAILALRPTTEELEEALAWAAGADDVMGELEIPAAGKAAQIYEILTANEEDDERR